MHTFFSVCCAPVLCGVINKNGNWIEGIKTWPWNQTYLFITRKITIKLIDLTCTPHRGEMWHLKLLFPIFLVWNKKLICLKTTFIYYIFLLLRLCFSQLKIQLAYLSYYISLDYLLISLILKNPKYTLLCWFAHTSHILKM